jgi:3-hydroxyisobutyrate dehydrogenase-like beta-hydroxyacid dehydrogenase
MSEALNGHDDNTTGGSMMTKIAYLGMGTMGSGMAANLTKAGHEVSAWNRTPKTSPVLQDAELRVTTDLATALEGAEVVMYCLSDDTAVDDLVFGTHNLLEHVPAGAVIIDLSTIDPETSNRERAAFEAKGHAFLDAPVFGTKGEAEGAGLWIVVGGPKDVFDSALPLFQAISETVHYMGEGGKGTSMKLVGNLLVASQLQALGEALTLAKKAGLNLADVQEVLDVADFRTPIYYGVGRGAQAGDYTVNFALKLMLKDAKLIQDFAGRLGSPVPTAATAQKYIEESIKDGHGDLNASALILAIAKEAGVNLAE